MLTEKCRLFANQTFSLKSVNGPDGRFYYLKRNLPLKATVGQRDPQTSHKKALDEAEQIINSTTGCNGCPIYNICLPVPFAEMVQKVDKTMECFPAVKSNYVITE